MTQTLGNASATAMDLLKEKLDKIIVHELPFTYKEYIDISDTINKQVLDPDIKPPFLGEDVKNADSIAQTYRGRRMHNWFIAYITRFAKSLAAEASNYTDGALLCFYTRKWSHFYLNSRAVGRLFISVETEWIAVERKFNPEFPTIEETMYQLWYLHFVCAISNRLSSAVTCLLQLEQEGHVADRSVLESAWRALSELRPKGIKEIQTSFRTNSGVYILLYECPYIETVLAFMKRELSRLDMAGNSSRYITRLDGLIKTEEARAEHYLHPASLHILRCVIQNHFVVKRLKTIAETITSLLSESERHSEVIRKAFLLIWRYKGGSYMKLICSALRNKARNNIINSFHAVNYIDNFTQSALTLVKTLARANNKNRQIAEELFSVDGSLDDRFSVVLEIAFCEAISSDSFARVYGHQPAKLFAEYCNINLSKHRAARLIDCRELVADQDLEAQALNEIQQLQVIIPSFNNKFELFMYYEMLLARRLVSNQYISLELERRALQDLKLSHILVGQADSSFRMISDKIGSDTITQKFIDCLACNSSGPQPAKVDISVCVFGSSVWPHAMQQTPEDSMRLPEIISNLYDSFENFYRREYHMKREISWNWRYSTATVKIYFPHTRSKRAAKSGYTFVLNMYQLAILTLFIKPRGFGTDNSASVDAHYMTFDQICQATQMKIDRLQSEVSILVRTKILVDAGNQTLFLNHRFSPKKSFFNISTVRRIQKISEENLALRFLDRERSFLIQSQAIRLLKHSGKLCFNELFEKVSNKLMGLFDVKLVDFKKAIESLFTKNFLKRDDDNRDFLVYIAL